MLQLLVSKLIVGIVMLLIGWQDAPKLPPDRHIGATMFKVVKTTDSGRYAYLDPLMIPTFEITRMDRGDLNKILDTTIVKCDVYEHYIEGDPTMVLTKLRCDGQDYAIAGVDFVMDDK